MVLLVLYSLSIRIPERITARITLQGNSTMEKNEVKHSDWPPAKVKYELQMRGLSFRFLSRKAGLAEDSLKAVQRTPCISYEKVIADAIGVPAEEIWPSRYAARNNSYINKVT